MTWKKILGQKRAKKILQRAVMDNQIAHSYCLWGIEGIGKDALAFEFAKLVNCKSPLIKEDGIEACDNCHSCRQAEILQHPNIQIIFSLPAGQAKTSRGEGALDKLSEEQIDEIKEQFELKASNPYHKLQLTNASEIKVASVRDIKKNLNMSAGSSGRRCIIIIRADEMSVESSNAFLKSLEEPADNTTIILTSSRHESILPTILSRCQQIRCEPLSQEEIKEYLVKEHHLDENQSNLVAAFSQGSLSRAFSFMDKDMKEMREKVVAILRTALRKKGYRLELIEKIDEISGSKDKTKHEIFINLLLLWIRDVYSLSCGSPATVLNSDQLETIQKFAQNFSGKNYEAAIEHIEKSIQLIRRNVQIQLIYLSMFIKLRECFF